MSQHRPRAGHRGRKRGTRRPPIAAAPALVPNPSPRKGEGSRIGAISWYVWPLAALVAFVLLAAFGGYAHGANVASLEWFQRVVPRYASDTVSSLLVLGSTSGSMFVVGVAGAILWVRGERRVALALGLLAVGLLTEFALKSWIGHPGVPAHYHREPRWYPVPDLGASDLELPSPFPSGHAMRTTFLALVGTALVARYLPSLATLARVGAGLVVALVAVLLVVMGWHWITDIAGGLLLGYAIATPARHFLGARLPLPLMGREARG